LPIEKPTKPSCGFEDSGNFFMRSGWGVNDLYLFFHCGQLGGGHGHADLLHLDVSAFGKDFLTDLGRYNYSDSYPLRKELKRAHSHNTTLVDGIDFTECIDTWNFGRIAAPLATKWVSEEAFDYVEGSHDGYFHLEDPVYVSRKIIFVKPYYWMLIDVFECKGEHSFSQNFHFAPGEIVLNEDTKSCSTQNVDEANLHLIPIISNPFTAAIKEGRISYEYNLVEQNKCVQYEIQSKGTTAMMQLLYPCKAGDQSMPTVTNIEVSDLFGDRVSEDAAQSIKIYLPQIKEEHLIIVCHQKPSLHRMSYVVDGTQIFGEIVLIKRKNGREEVFVVK
jgi:Heparinase II/III-like protein